MILTLLWKWLSGLWRDAHPPPALEASKPTLGADLNFVNRSSDAGNSKVVIFEGEEADRPAT